ncbi:MAG: tetratricopeptide repeat protein [Bacteroidia bacterium]|nr:tetratricopeptide repeat protein [Bacteroidia bacterium]
MIKYSFFLVFLFGFISFLNAQKTLIYSDNNYEFNRGLELFNKEKFGASQQHFKYFLQNSGAELSDIRSDAEYYIAICAIKLFNKDAEYLLSSFISKYPESSRIKTAYFQMGNYQFVNKKYSKAVSWFEKVDINILNKEEQAEYYFKAGYSYYLLEDYENAGKFFYEIKDIDTKYTVYALYYYSHIEYMKGNYQTALLGFQKLSDNEMFAPIIPYYITHIYFYQGKYDEIIKYAPPLLEADSSDRATEIARIIGEAYYRTFHYKEAIPYLERYMDNSTITAREDYYKIAYCYYREKQYEKAAKKFSSIANATDLLAQNDYYHLADCYIRLAKKNKARYAFLAASNLNFDASISENALFNYAMLCYELSMYPFNEAIKAFSSFIEKYPGSPLLDDANKYLVEVFMTTKNYKEALNSLESIEKITQDIALIYQRVAYYRGLELFLDKDFEEAIIHFDKSLNNVKLNPVIKAQALYWRGEGYFRLKRYTEAINTSDIFIKSDGAFQLPEYKATHYNLGYSHFMLKNYAEAILWFRKYVNFMGETKDSKVADAFNRIGDSYFIQRKYEDAVLYYDKALVRNIIDIDYTLYQKGLISGLLNEQNEKIKILNQLVSDYQKSGFRPAAMYELAKSYVVIESPEMAVSTYQMLMHEYPNSDYIRMSYMNLGQIYYNMGKNEESLSTYKEAVKQFWGEAIVDDALDEIEKIYTEMNNIDGYFDYRNSIGHSVSLAKEDSLSYYAAEKVFMLDNCDEAKRLFEKYIEKFTDGRYLLSANFYKAECNLRANEEDDALACYDYISSQDKSKYSTVALQRSARILYKRKLYEKAAAYYTKLEEYADAKNIILEARIGKMRCDYLTGKYDTVIKSSVKVLNSEKVSEEIVREAHFYIAKSYYTTGNFQAAFDEFQLLAGECKSKEGAEAKYRVAELYHNMNQDSLAEIEVIDFNRQMTPHKYWVAKGILLLSGIYVKKGDTFQAKAMLYSIITNYGELNDGIVEEAENMLEEIVATEQAEEILDRSLEMPPIQMGNHPELYYTGPEIDLSQPGKNKPEEEYSPEKDINIPQENQNENK